MHKMFKKCFTVYSVLENQKALKNTFQVIMFKAEDNSKTF